MSHKNDVRSLAEEELAKIGIFFDDLNRLRLVDPEMSQKQLDIKVESAEFTKSVQRRRRRHEMTTTTQDDDDDTRRRKTTETVLNDDDSEFDEFGATVDKLVKLAENLAAAVA